MNGWKDNTGNLMLTWRLPPRASMHHLFHPDSVLGRQRPGLASAFHYADRQPAPQSLGLNHNAYTWVGVEPPSSPLQAPLSLVSVLGGCLQVLGKYFSDLICFKFHNSSVKSGVSIPIIQMRTLSPRAIKLFTQVAQPVIGGSGPRVA